MVDVDECTGCKICELVCSMKIHGEYNPSKSYIKVLQNKELDVNLPVLNAECVNHHSGCSKCVDFCPTKCLRFTSLKEGALTRKGTKIGVIPTPLVGGM
jgi:carbon-monoxide dehydrogenase iron sulfur subunit